MCLLKNIFLVLAPVLALAADLESSGSTTSIGKKKHKAELICKEICQEPLVHNIEEATGKLMKFKSYDPMSEKCICVNFRGGTVSRKLYKASEADNKKPIESPDAAQKPNRQGRQVVLESISDTGEKIITSPSQGLGSPLGPEGPLVVPGLDVPPLDDMMLIPPGGGMGFGLHDHHDDHGRHRNHQHRHRPSGQGQYGSGGSHGHRPHECTPMSCSHKCPHDCDSLCRYNGECYCSCPEDMTYEYYDSGSSSFFGSIFG